MARSIRLVGIVLASVALAACSGGDSITVLNPRIGEPTGPNAALYFTVESGEADRLLAVHTNAASSAQIHETIMGDDGTMGMQPIDWIDVAAGSATVLEPGGLHVMLLDVTRLEVGDSVEIELTWEKAGAMTIEAEVVAPDETMGQGDG